jgi:hypothetical protein
VFAPALLRVRQPTGGAVDRLLPLLVDGLRAEPVVTGDPPLSRRGRVFSLTAGRSSSGSEFNVICGRRSAIALSGTFKVRESRDQAKGWTVFSLHSQAEYR